MKKSKPKTFKSAREVLDHYCPGPLTPKEKFEKRIEEALKNFRQALSHLK